MRFYLVGWGMVGGGMISLWVLAVWVSWTYISIFYFKWSFLEIQLFFSVSILPSIALKRWNLPDNLDFNGKIMAKFLIRSLISLNLKWYDNKITNWTQSYSKYVTCIMAFFTPFHFVTFGQFYPTLPLRYSLNFTKKL